MVYNMSAGCAYSDHCACRAYIVVILSDKLLFNSNRLKNEVQFQPQVQSGNGLIPKAERDDAVALFIHSHRVKKYWWINNQHRLEPQRRSFQKTLHSNLSSASAA